MSNMSYCRFENTYRDLVDCYHNINSELSDHEHKYREWLVSVCKSIVRDYDPSCQPEEDLGPEYDGAGFTDSDR